jgi:hypothetical protein
MKLKNGDVNTTDVPPATGRTVPDERHAAQAAQSI